MHGLLILHFLFFFIDPEEQYIILIFETGLDPQANAIFEKIITEIGIRNNISDFFVKITFEEANSRLVAFTKSFEDTSRGSSGPKESKAKHVLLLKNYYFYNFIHIHIVYSISLKKTSNLICLDYVQTEKM